MKKQISILLVALFALTALSAYGCDGEDADLVFVNGSNAVIIAVLADFTDEGWVVRYTGSSPLKQGESFGFERGAYPVTIVVYDSGVEDFSKTALARLAITSIPPDGERWYVAARNGEDGLMLSADTKWPKGM